MFITLFLFSYVVLKAPVESATVGNEAEAESILRRMEERVRDFRDHIEDMYKYRCHRLTLTECANGNFDECSSTYPNSQCIDASEFIDSTCGNGNNCNGKFE